VESAPNEDVEAGVSTAGDLRATWLIVGGVVTVALAANLTPSRIILVVVPWLLAAAVLLSPTHGNRVATAWRDTLSSRLERMSLVVLGGLTLVAVQLITLAGTLMLAMPIVVAAILLAARAGRRRGSRLLVSGTLAAVVLTALLFAGELVLRIPAVAWRVGGPSAREMVNARYDQLWTRNIFAARSSHETIRKPPGVRRIVVVGDSYTFGALIPDTDSIWTSHLERQLSRHATDGKLEVINLARNGFTTANEAEMMRRLGWQFDPDLVIVQYLANDVLRSESNFRHDDERTLVPVRRLLPATFLEGAVRSSALLAYVRQRLRALEIKPTHLRYIEYYREGEKGWDQLRLGLREIGDSARARGVPVVFAIFPVFPPGEWGTDDYPLRDVHEQVAHVARAAGMQILDVTPAFVAEGGDWQRWWVTPFDGHPNTEGHAIIARYIAGVLDSVHVASRPDSPSVAQ
jgi:lysophospholipase L1-like esterase